VTGDLTVFRFSTDDYPAHQRVMAWRELFGEHLLRLEVEAKERDRFHANATIRMLPDVGIMTGSFGDVRFLRPHTVSDSDDAFLTLGATGAQVRQGRHEASIGEGDGLLGLAAETIFADVPACRFTTLRIPMSAFPHSVVRSGRICCDRIPAGFGPLQLLRQYLRVLDDQQMIATPELQQLAATHIQDLVTLAVGATGDAAEFARERGGRAARQRAVLELVARHASEPGFNPSRAAVLLGISVRYVHRLLEPTGRSFADHLLSHRLQRAANMLRDPHFAHLKIAVVATDAGFSDISHFNRTFRHAFGDTPYGLRVRAARRRQN
jgi:AraC-like DNA-binding protein